MKKLFLLLAVALVALSASAQLYQKPEKVGKFETELFLGPSIGYNYHGVGSDGGAAFGLEMRGNLSNSPWSVGGFLRYDLVGYTFNYHSTTADEQYLDNTLTNNIVSIGAMTEFNFRQGRKVNPFAGLGLGLAFYSSGGSEAEHPYDTDGTSAIFIPRIGVELWGWVRFTAYTVLLRKGYNATGITVGVTFGGKRKKTTN